MPVTDYIRTYKKFISSHYFYEGVRMTAGVIIPVLVATYFGKMQWGTVMALGAMCVSLTDNPGPIHHRRNGMLATILMVSCLVFLTGLFVPHPWLLAVFLAIFAFAFSIMGVYGVRTTSIGTACLLVMVLHIDNSLPFKKVLENTGLTAVGGLWYFLLSTALHTLRPYKLVQQVLGDCMVATADYLRVKAQFYPADVDYDKSYTQLLEAQVDVHNKQQVVRELLFKTRSIVKESTHTGRVLVMSFLDTVDLFERIMTSQQDYKNLHASLDETGILPSFGSTIELLANDLHELGIAFQEGTALKPGHELPDSVLGLEERFMEVRHAYMNESNIEAFIGLRHILESIKDLQSRLDTLHHYSTYDKDLSRKSLRQVDYERFVPPSDFTTKMIVGNLNLHANIFRHSIRMVLALLMGYGLSFIMPLGHDYWILLTIIVILKPAYALTKRRNRERLGGTVLGAALGGLILFFIKDEHVLVALIVICMTAAYSLIRTNYFLCVIFMTAYVLVAFHFLKPGNFTVLLQDRLVDTGIGSAIALFCTFLIAPRWEHEQMAGFCKDALQASRNYFAYIASAFSGSNFLVSEYKFLRKETYVNLANLSDAFQRMLSEPKSKQQHEAELHQLVVSNHVLASHVAALSAYRVQFADDWVSPDFNAITQLTLQQLDAAIDTLGRESNEILINMTHNQQPIAIRQQVDELLQQRLHELKQGWLETDTRRKLSELKAITDQFEMILRVSGDIRKVTEKLF